MGVTFLDFSADSLNSPMRALLLDKYSVNDQVTGFNIQAFLAGVGASCGFLLSALVTNMQTLYYIVAAVFISCVISTMTSAKEKPFDCSKTNPKAKLKSNIYLTQILDVSVNEINLDTNSENPGQIKKESENLAKYYLHVIVLLLQLRAFKNLLLCVNPT